jgi:molecular chaperone DnaK (HSP70)
MILEQSPTFIDPNGKLVEDFGLEIQGGRFAVLLKNGSRVPCEATFTFSTFADGQDQILITLYRGTGELTQFNRFVGRVQVIGIPPAPARTPMIAVTFRISTDAVSITAVDRTTGRSMQVIAVE